MKKLLVGGAFALLVSASQAAVYNYDVTGINSWDGIGDPSNTVVLLDLGGGSSVTMTGIGWDVVLSTFGDSWISELRASFSDSANSLTGAFGLRPGAGTNTPGTSMPFSSGGIIDLTSVGLPDLVLADGILRMEFNESFDDISDSIDGVWKAGLLNIEHTGVPEPATFLALGAGLALLAARRRRS